MVETVKSFRAIDVAPPRSPGVDGDAVRLRDNLIKRCTDELTSFVDGAGQPTRLSGTSALIAAYKRKTLISQMLWARRDEPDAVAKLAQQFPGLAGEIQQARNELAASQNAIVVQLNRQQIPTTLYWTDLSGLASHIALQNQTDDMAGRRRAALDLIARMRLHVPGESYTAIEGALPAIAGQARTLAAHMRPEEYPLLRLELLSLPLSDVNHTVQIRNLAIELNALLPVPTGQNLRNAVHNAAGPSNIPTCADVLRSYLPPNPGGAQPDAGSISAFMELRRLLKVGDVEAAKALLGPRTQQMEGYAPAFAEALATLRSDPPAALAKIDLVLPQVLQGLPSAGFDNVGYGPVEIYNKLAELYDELNALYANQTSIERLARNFPFWAPLEVQQELSTAMAYLKTDDHLAALQELARARRDIRELVVPGQASPVQRLVGALEQNLAGLADEFAPVAARINEASALAGAVIEDFVSRHSAARPLKRSTIEITQINAGSNAPAVSATALRGLNDFLACVCLGEVDKAVRLGRVLGTHFSGHQNFAQLSTAIGQLATAQPIGQALALIDSFLNSNGAQRRPIPGDIDQVPVLRGDRNGQLPNQNAIGQLQNLLVACRNGDVNGARAQLSTLGNFGNYPNYQQTLAPLQNLVQQNQPVAALPYLEEFLLTNRGVGDAELRASFTLDDGSRPKPELTEQLVRLRRLVSAGYHLRGNPHALSLVQLDGRLDEMSAALLATLGERFADPLPDAQLGASLIALRAGIESMLASGLTEIAEPERMRRVELLGHEANTPAKVPALGELLRQLDGLMQKPRFDRQDVEALEALAANVAERVWQAYVDISASFAPRVELVAAQKNLADPAFVDNLIKEGPLTHVKALANAVHAWCAEKLGRTSELGAAVQNPKGLRVMSEGRAVLKRIVIADKIENIPKDTVLDEHTLLVLSTVGNENVSMAGTVLVNRAKEGGAGAGGQFSHIFVWTRNAGVAGAAFENATEIVQDLQKQFVDKLLDKEEIYLAATRDGFRLAPVSVAKARGWLKDEEIEKLRPGPNTFVRFMLPDGAGGLKPDSASLRLSRSKPGREVLSIDVPYPMAELEGLGGKQLNLQELNKLSASHMEALVGPKAAVLAALRRQGSGWNNAVLPGRALPFGQLQRWLDAAGVLDALRKLEPALQFDGDGFWASRFMNDAAYRNAQLDRIQKAIGQGLSSYLLEDDGQGGKRPSAVAAQELLQPLKADPEFAAPNGTFKPLIVRSTANAEDLPNFNAAGKHHTVANVLSDRDLIEAVTEVAMSLWSREAVENRRLFGIDSRLAAMGVLVQPVLEPEVSGVLATRDEAMNRPNVFTYQATRGLFGGVEGAAQIQESELRQGGGQLKVPYRAELKVVLDPQGGTKQAPAEPTNGAGLLTPQQEQTLFSYATQIKALFDKDIHPGERLDLDIEFMVVRGAIIITQARPLPARTK